MLEVIHGDTVLHFEHSLLALSKWEARTKKAFLGSSEKTNEEMIDYYCDMLLTPGVRREVVYELSPQTLVDLHDYINDSQSAQKPIETDTKGSPGVTTSDRIYSWMALSKIPFQPAETWHLNRVMMVITLVQSAQQPPKKKSRFERLAQWAETNEANKKFFKSNG